MRENIDEPNTAHIDERLPVSVYLRKIVHTVDGLAWLAISVISVICLLDVILSLDILPTRYTQDQGKAIVLFLFSPLLIFLILVRFRQFQFSGSGFASWLRAGICVAVFFLINF